MEPQRRQSAAIIGTAVEAATGPQSVANSSISATDVKPLMSIRVPIATVCSPRDSALGISHPLPSCVSNKFVNIDRLKELLSDYPDQSLVSSIITGFKFGFDIGFRGTVTNTFPDNNRSAYLHKDGVT